MDIFPGFNLRKQTMLKCPWEKHWNLLGGLGRPSVCVMCEQIDARRSAIQVSLHDLYVVCSMAGRTSELPPFFSLPYNKLKTYF